MTAHTPCSRVALYGGRWTARSASSSPVVFSWSRPASVPPSALRDRRFLDLGKREEAVQEHCRRTVGYHELTQLGKLDGELLFPVRPVLLHLLLENRDQEAPVFFNAAANEHARKIERVDQQRDVSPQLGRHFPECRFI